MKTIRKYCERMRDEDVRRAIIVLIGPMTSFARQAIAEMAPKYILETFNETELMVNITEHVLVPKHILLKPEVRGAAETCMCRHVSHVAQEKLELLRRYNLKETQLPRIQISDPVARYYGLQRGQVRCIVHAPSSWLIDIGCKNYPAQRDGGAICDIQTGSVRE